MAGLPEYLAHAARLRHVSAAERDKLRDAMDELWATLTPAEEEIARSELARQKQDAVEAKRTKTAVLVVTLTYKGKDARAPIIEGLLREVVNYAEQKGHFTDAFELEVVDCDYEVHVSGD